MNATEKEFDIVYAVFAGYLAIYNCNCFCDSILLWSSDVGNIYDQMQRRKHIVNMCYESENDNEVLLSVDITCSRYAYGAASGHFGNVESTFVLWGRLWQSGFLVLRCLGSERSGFSWKPAFSQCWRFLFKGCYLRVTGFHIWREIKSRG